MILFEDGQKFFVHALVDDNEVGCATQQAFGVDLIDSSDARQIFRPRGHLIFGIGTPDDFATDCVQRLQKARARHDNPRRFFIQNDLSAGVIGYRREDFLLNFDGRRIFFRTATAKQKSRRADCRQKFFNHDCAS